MNIKTLSSLYTSHPTSLRIGPESDSYIVIDGKIVGYLTELDVSLEAGIASYSARAQGDVDAFQKDSPFKELELKLLAAEAVIRRNKLQKEYKKDCKVLEVADNL